MEIENVISPPVETGGDIKTCVESVCCAVASPGFCSRNQAESTNLTLLVLMSTEVDIRG